MISALKNRTISRFEGLLLKKGRFFGWKLIWAVLERGVFSFFANRADAASGIRRKGYKYLEDAISERVNSPETDQHMFIIIFGDRSRALFSLPKSQSELDLQKWLNAINDHIYFGTNFIKQASHFSIIQWALLIDMSAICRALTWVIRTMRMKLHNCCQCLPYTI